MINGNQLSVPSGCGAVAQMVERSLSMREVLGSIPSSSSFLPFYIFFLHFCNFTSWCTINNRQSSVALL